MYFVNNFLAKSTQIYNLVTKSEGCLVFCITDRRVIESQAGVSIKQRISGDEKSGTVWPTRTRRRAKLANCEKILTKF